MRFFFNLSHHQHLNSPINYPLTPVLFLIMGFYCPHFYPQNASLFVEISIGTRHCVDVISQELPRDPNVFCQSPKGVPNVTLGSNRVSGGKVICSEDLCALILFQGLNLGMYCIRIHEDIKASIPK